MARELWRSIGGYEGLYEVSDAGRVRRIDRPIPLVMRQAMARGGYRVVTLSKGHRPQSYRVHRLVADAFIPADPSRPEIDHVDSDPSNNVLANLSRASRSENVLRAIRSGRLTPPRLSRTANPRARLTENDVAAIRSSEASQYELARRFGVCRTQIRNIRRGLQWRPSVSA